MARPKGKSKPSSKRRYTTSQIVFYILSLLIVLSMTIGFVISMLPTPVRRQPLPTPTGTPTPTAQPSATPTATGAEPDGGPETTPQPDQ